MITIATPAEEAELSKPRDDIIRFLQGCNVYLTRVLLVIHMRATNDGTLAWDVTSSPPKQTTVTRVRDYFLTLISPDFIQLRAPSFL